MYASRWLYPIGSQSDLSLVSSDDSQMNFDRFDQKMTEIPVKNTRDRPRKRIWNWFKCYILPESPRSCRSSSSSSITATTTANSCRSSNSCGSSNSRCSCNSSIQDFVFGDFSSCSETPSEVHSAESLSLNEHEINKRKKNWLPKIFRTKSDQNTTKQVSKPQSYSEPHITYDPPPCEDQLTETSSDVEKSSIAIISRLPPKGSEPLITRVEPEKLEGLNQNQMRLILQRELITNLKERMGRRRAGPPRPLALQC